MLVLEIQEAQAGSHHRGRGCGSEFWGLWTNFVTLPSLRGSLDAARRLIRRTILAILPNHSRILLIAYLFPPAGGVGVLRALSFAKYLPQFGHEVHVLSAWNPSTPTLDPSLVRQIPPQVRMHHAFTPEIPFHLRQKLWKLISPARSISASDSGPIAAAGDAKGLKAKLVDQVRCFFSPDPEVVWVPFALRRARQIIRHHDIDVVLVTVPPFSSLQIGSAMKRDFPQIRLISDFRDEWFQFHLSVFDFHNNDHTLRRAREIESTSVNASDLVLSVAPSIIAQMRARHPSQSAEKFAVVTNGFDPDLVAGFTPRPHGGKKVLVTFVGTIYGASTLRYYLEALDSLPEPVRSRFETRLIGRIADDEKKPIARAKSCIKVLGFMPQADSFRQMEEADFLLLTMIDPSCITGKFFDYIGTGKPMLAFTPGGGEVQRMLSETDAGWWADYRDREGIRGVLLRAHDVALAGTIPQIAREVADQFSRARLTAQLSKLIQGLTEDGSRPGE
jgi:glycosyltransferase involved in cell wall biosynthesis